VGVSGGPRLLLKRLDASIQVLLTSKEGRGPEAGLHWGADRHVSTSV